MRLIAAHEVTTALIAMAGVVITGAFGFAAVLVQQRRTSKKVDQVYDHVNRSEEQVIDPNHVGEGPQTFRQEVRSGFKRIDAVHEVLTRGIQDTTETLHEHNQRIGRVEREIGLDE